MKGMVVVLVVWGWRVLAVCVWAWEEQGVREEEDEVRGSAEVEGRCVICSQCGASKSRGCVQGGHRTEGHRTEHHMMGTP